MKDARVASAMSHWAPRFVSNGVILADFEEVTASLDRWDDWCAAWSARAKLHEDLGHESLRDGHRLSAGEHYVRAAMYYHFAKFVWILDVSSGHVISAELDGIVLRRMEFGPLHRTVEARIRASMSTVRSAGFRAQRQILGQRVFDLCDADDGECTLVAPVPYDPRTGYVNAVGVISARTRGAGADNFSSLGEARFTELHTESAPAVAAGPGIEAAAEQP